jgi:hypothetical protein
VRAVFVVKRPRNAAFASGTSSSPLNPCGVNSNTQATPMAGKKPTASRKTTLRAIHSGTPNIGKIVPAT